MVLKVNRKNSDKVRTKLRQNDEKIKKIYLAKKYDIIESMLDQTGDKIEEKILKVKTKWRRSLELLAVKLRQNFVKW